MWRAKDTEKLLGEFGKGSKDSSSSSSRGGGLNKRGPKPKYSQVPISILADPEVTGQEVEVLALLLVYSREKEYCWPFQKTLARTLGVKRQSVSRSLIQLKEKGKIDIYETNDGSFEEAPENPKSKIYDLTPLEYNPYRKK